MRIKLSLLKLHGNNKDGVIALHHQRILSSFLEELMPELHEHSQSYNFSSLKGTSKVMTGQIRFLSTKLSLVISSSDQALLEMMLKKIFERGNINLGKLSLIPKSYQVISEPNFQTVMKYVCISPVILGSSFQGDPPEPLDPATHNFSDSVFDSIISRMEQAGYTDAQLNDFAEFEITPDAAYMQKIQHNAKKYARVYKNNNNESFYGYLLPVFIHAHPEVHKFIWERGLGLFTNEGYGMLDTVPEAPAATEPMVP